MEVVFSLNLVNLVLFADPSMKNLENLRASMIVRSFDLSFDHEVKDVEVLMPWLLQRLVRVKKGDLLGGLLEAQKRLAK